MHASGHNPRSNQGQRQRQRVYHKFRIYPEKFDDILCTGCGNCTRNCPVGLGVLPLVEAIAKEPCAVSGNIYKPDLMEVIQVQRQTPDVKSVRMRFRDPARAKEFSFRVGPVRHLLGVRLRRVHVQHLLQFELEGLPSNSVSAKTGKVTEALWQVEKGDTIGFRGPYGNCYPMEKWEGKNLIFIGGGIAMPPIRCAIWYALENRAEVRQHHASSTARAR